MRVDRTEYEGVALLRLSGEVGFCDAPRLLGFIGDPARLSGDGCIIDFQGVEHVNFHVFELLEEWFSVHPDLLVSGLNDYILDIFAFVRRKDVIPVFSDWRKAYRFFKAENRKLSASSARGLFASC
ncbi:MAG: hypothetical protein JW746_02155 [Candidatus Krumholzibacteriota bacterium]|nr:hypothetical protein [Candidatus Krumholzibacteriota bacterium]